jgi:hypothetical protein
VEDGKNEAKKKRADGRRTEGREEENHNIKGKMRNKRNLNWRRTRRKTASKKGYEEGK